MPRKQAERSLFDGSDLLVSPHNGTATSVAAARSIEHKAASLRARVLEFIANRPGQGATIDEIAEGTGILTQTVCGRISELKGLGQIKDSGQTRLTRSRRLATVWVVG